MDESGHCATPWLGGTVQTDGKGIQNTRLGSINDLGRDIFIFQIESKARQAPGWVHLPHTPFCGRWLKQVPLPNRRDRKSTRLNSSHMSIWYAVFCLQKIITALAAGNALSGLPWQFLFSPETRPPFRPLLSTVLIG